MEIKLKLLNDLKLALKDCEEIWIAVAMISDSGFDIIQKNINPTAKQNYLVGIGLPTSPNVLKQLMLAESNGLFQSKIYNKPDTLFHPKIYIIKTNEKLVAFVGSGNCTYGGLVDNIEMGAEIDDENYCKKALVWFNACSKTAQLITEEFLYSYESLFHKRNERIKKDQDELKSLFATYNNTVNLDEIDFSNQFFQKEHFQAFEGKKPRDRSEESNRERHKVRNHLFNLHYQILPKIKEKKWNLAEHYTPSAIVSSALHGEFTADALEAIWLHYGRSKKEIKAYGEDETPLSHMRLQIIIHQSNVGVWNRIGKDKGSFIDRDNLRKNLMTSEEYRNNFFSIISSLPENYLIELNEIRKYVDEFENESQLTEFLLSAKYNHYFIIGIEFTPDDPKLSAQNIVNTVIENFELLYPTYEMIKDKTGSMV